MVTGLSHLKQHGYVASEAQAGQANVCGFKKKKNLGTCYSFNVLRMKAYNTVKQYQELFEISFCFWLLSGDQYYGPLCCERKSKESPSCLWFTQWAIAKLFASKCG